MVQWRNDAELLRLMREGLYSPVLGDALDRHGRPDQFLPPQLKPIHPDMVLAGRAMPVVHQLLDRVPERPFGRMLEALDDLKSGEVYIGGGPVPACAAWGEIMTAAAMRCGAAGAVVNGYHRDTPRVLEQNWPVFSRGGWAPDSAPRMQVVDYRCPVQVGRVLVRPGDLIFGDVDGIVVVPTELVEPVIAEALEKARAEKTVRRAIEQGMSASEAFEKYGVL